MKRIVICIEAVILISCCMGCSVLKQETSIFTDTPEVISEFSDGDYSGVVYSDGRVELQKYSGCEPYIEIPEEIDGNQINSIGFGFGNSRMTRVTIPECVINVEPGAFMPCLELSEFRVDAKNPVLAEIDGVLFSKETKTLICYPSGRQDENYEIPNGIRSISGGAFFFCQAMRSIAIPESVEAFDPIIADDGYGQLLYLANPFIMCMGLEEFKVDEGNRALKVINNALYSNDGKVLICCPPESIPFGVGSQFTVADGTEIIGDVAFGCCTNLSEVFLPKTLKVIETGAFLECGLLNGIEVPANVEKVGECAFYDCTGITDAVLPENLGVIANGLFAGCSSLSNINIPDGVTLIGGDAFSNCISLKNLIIPKGVEYIEPSAFVGTDMTLDVADDSYAERFAEEYSIPYKTY